MEFKTNINVEVGLKEFKWKMKSPVEESNLSLVTL